MHGVVNIATIGVEKWGDKIYRIAVQGATIPHIHIYLNNDSIPYHEFDFEISLIDILYKGEINLLSQIDKHRNIYSIIPAECSWTGYEDIKDGIRNFLFSSCNNTHFSDNLALAIYEWSKETDFVKTECEGRNLIGLLFKQTHLTPLPEYEKYLCDYEV